MEISTQKVDIDLDKLYQWISGSYWAKNIPRDIFNTSIENSICFSAIENGKFIGFARVVTDHATFAYLADVIVDPDHRGKGVGKAIIEKVTSHDTLAKVRTFLLITKDAQGLYEKYGFEVYNEGKIMKVPSTINFYD